MAGWMSARRVICGKNRIAQVSETGDGAGITPAHQKVQFPPGVSV